MGIPYHYFITAVSGDVENRITHIRMAVIRKHHHFPAPSVKHPALIHIGIVHKKLFRFSSPVNGQTHAAVLIGFKAVIQPSVGIKIMDNTLISPEVDRDDFKAGQIIPEIGNGRILYMAKVMMFKNPASAVGEKDAFITGGAEQLQIPAGTKPEQRHTVRMILKPVIQGPEAFSVIVKKCISHHQLIFSVSINVRCKRIVACIAFGLPQQPQFFVKRPEIPVTILQNNIAVISESL